MRTHSAFEIANMLGPTVEDDGFVCDKLRWYRYEEESILVIDVQPARYSSGAYINLGVYYRKYGEIDRPKIVECHLDARLTGMLPNPLRGDDLLDTSNDIPLEIRRAELETMIRSYAIPWLKRMGRSDDAKLVLAQNPKAAHVAPIVRAELVTPN